MADAAEEIAHLESLSGGKPIAEARDDVQSSIEVFRYFAGFADKLHGSFSALDRDPYAFQNWTVRQNRKNILHTHHLLLEETDWSVRSDYQLQLSPR